MRNGRIIAKETKKERVARLAQPCDTEGCESQAVTKGRCGACYQGMRRLEKRVQDDGLGYLTAYLYKVGRLQRRGNETFINLQPKRRGGRKAAA
jgi:hypothetical protein